MRNQSSLVVLGRDGATAAAVTAATNLQPTRSLEAEDQPALGSARGYSAWQLTVKSEATDESGFGSLRSLLGLVVPAAAALQALQGKYEVRIDWGGFSDSSQGGFVLDVDIVRELATVGLPLYGTAYVE